MALAPGARLGPYEILSLIGAGGMGEVYRARDSKLNRDVAIKVLPELFTADPDRLARFRREAQVLASLNHPNIGHIYGLEDQSGVQALVLELVEGPTLADRIAQGAIPLEEALPIARQIADALECAHEQGIVHRDLKPANIKVRDDGTVKVLDFGLAKALDPSTSSGEVMNSPTLTARATQMGLILGTAAYMAPEQARGRVVDRRADIWAFGVVLYEMLTGRRAFEGDDISITLASVLKDDLKWSELPSDLPSAVRRLLRRCLEKDPKRRLSAIGDARLDLEDMTDDRVALPVAVQPAVVPQWKRAVPWVVAGLAIAGALASFALWGPWRASSAPPPVRLTAELGIDAALSPNIGPAAVLSPDGRMMALVARSPGGRNLLHVRRLNDLQATVLAGTEDAIAPFFSPDSQWIGFFTQGKLKKIAVTGGAAVPLCDAPEGRGGSWGEDGTIVFQPTSAPSAILQRVSEAGGSAAAIGQQAEGETMQRWPQVLPGGRAVLYSGNTTSIGWDSGSIMAQPVSGGVPKVVLSGGFHGRYMRSGHLMYVRDGTLFAVTFDPDRLETRGTPTPVLQDVLVNNNTGGAQFSVADNGTLVYVTGKSLALDVPIWWMDHTGKSTVLRAEPSDWYAPRFSPDGRKLAITIGGGSAADVWIADWARDTLSKFTFGPTNDMAPVWTPDGRRIAFSSEAARVTVNNLLLAACGRTGEVQRLTDSPNVQVPWSFHLSGKYLAFVERAPDTGNDIMLLPFQGDEKSGWKVGKPTVFLRTPATETSPMFSPDGRWIAYMSSESGNMEVYVRPFQRAEGKWKISTGGPSGFPVWSHRELLYVELGPPMSIMAAAFAADGDSFRAEKPRRWSPGFIVPSTRHRPYDLHPDGLRVAISKASDVPAQQREKVVFVFNFFDEVRRVVK